MMFSYFTYSMMGVLICKYEPFWQDLVSAACGPLGFFFILFLFYFKNLRITKTCLHQYRSIFFSSDLSEVPTKCVAATVTLDINANIQYIDFEGRSDGESIKKILLQIKPRQLVCRMFHKKTKLYIEIKNARNKLFLHNFIYCGIIIFCGGLMFLDLVGVLLPTNLRPKECLTN